MNKNQIDEVSEIISVLTEAAQMGCEEIPLTLYGQSICMKTPCNRCKEARLLVSKGYHRESNLTPCDLCEYNPPSSGDGKPCVMCPAHANMKGGME